MNAIQQLLTDHIDIWTAADTTQKSNRGRSSGNAASVYGIKKLRELILELAVRGKLVPQDENDEPASELLKRIQIEKAKLIAEGKIKKNKPLVEVTDDEKPYTLPQGWEWCRIAHVGHDWGQKTPDSDFTYIEVSAIDSKYGIVSSPELVKPENAPSRARKLVKKDTVIYSTVRPYLLNIAVIEQDFLPEPIASTAFAVIHPFCTMPSRYFLSFFRSPVFVRYVESVQMGIAYPAINDGQFFSGLIPLPPVEEQHRIVAKVDELMALCDQMENQHCNASEAHEQLVSYLLGTLTQTQSAEDFSANWQRIAAHFDTLFTTEASIDALKQTLLQLAVMGKLVPQDSNDEPASELLKRIQVVKAKLIAEGNIKKDKPLAPITDKEKPFGLPQGWEWVRLQAVIDVRDGTHDSPKEALGSETYPLVTSKDFFDGDINFDTARKISEADHLEISKRSLVEKYDILFSMIGGNIGNQVMVNDDRPFSIKNVALFKYYDRSLTFPFFIKKYTENLAVNLQSTAIGGAQPFVALGALRNLVMALPPLGEQNRIVAKVDELMAICDQLKSRLTEANQLQQKLADVMVEQAIQ